MRTRLALAFLLFFSLTAYTAEPTADHTFFVVTGVLYHYRDAYWQVTVPASHEIQVKGKRIDAIRFSPDWFTETSWCQKYEGKTVEISGKLDSSDTKLLRLGIAKITLHGLTLGEHGPTPAQALMRRFVLHEPDLNHHAPGQPLYRFAYYLVLLGKPEGCERCYVPLLVSPEPLETLVQTNASINVVSITTYDRDSIWQKNGLALITSDAIDLHSNTLDFRGERYRYEHASDESIIYLLEHPLGRLPVSRPFLPQYDVPGADVADLIANLHTMFRVRERRSGLNPDSVGGTSEITVFDDGKVQYRSAPGCINRSSPSNLPASHHTAESWNWRETCPGSQRVEKESEHVLNAVEFSKLKDLLNRNEVKQLRGCFCNATFGIGDYSIEIARQDSTQPLQAVGFMPEHVDLREHPALTYLICEARAISQQVTNEVSPSWCSDLPPLK